MFLSVSGVDFTPTKNCFISETRAERVRKVPDRRWVPRQGCPLTSFFPFRSRERDNRWYRTDDGSARVEDDQRERCGSRDGDEVYTTVLSTSQTRRTFVWGQDKEHSGDVVRLSEIVLESSDGTKLTRSIQVDLGLTLLSIQSGSRHWTSMSQLFVCLTVKWDKFQEIECPLCIYVFFWRGFWGSTVLSLYLSLDTVVSYLSMERPYLHPLSVVPSEGSLPLWDTLRTSHLCLREHPVPLL